MQGIDEDVKDYEIRRHALFYTDAGARSLYRQNVRQALLRRNSVNGRVYRDDPTIMAWGLLNEPRCEAWKVRGTGLRIYTLYGGSAGKVCPGATQQAAIRGLEGGRHWTACTL